MVRSATLVPLDRKDQRQQAVDLPATTCPDFLGRRAQAGRPVQLDRAEGKVRPGHRRGQERQVQLDCLVTRGRSEPRVLWAIPALSGRTVSTVRGVALECQERAGIKEQSVRPVLQDRPVHLEIVRMVDQARLDQVALPDCLVELVRRVRVD